MVVKRSSVRQTPAWPSVASKVRRLEAELELKLLADVGPVGLPNAGKSTHPLSVTNAARNANYALYDAHPKSWCCRYRRRFHLTADIALAEGGRGQGPGDQFCAMWSAMAVPLHPSMPSSSDAAADYQTIRSELGCIRPSFDPP